MTLLILRTVCRHGSGSAGRAVRDSKMISCKDADPPPARIHPPQPRLQAQLPSGRSTSCTLAELPRILVSYRLIGHYCRGCSWSWRSEDQPGEFERRPFIMFCRPPTCPVPFAHQFPFSSQGKLFVNLGLGTTGLVFLRRVARRGPMSSRLTYRSQRVKSSERH